MSFSAASSFSLRRHQYCATCMRVVQSLGPALASASSMRFATIASTSTRIGTTTRTSSHATESSAPSAPVGSSAIVNHSRRAAFGAWSTFTTNWATSFVES
jgi:hypothetical protein